VSRGIWQWLYLGLCTDPVVKFIPDPMTIFTEREIQFLQDTEFLKTKADILQKIEETLSKVEASLRQEMGKSTFQFPEGTLKRSGKISRGENYGNLPYMVLDFPRKFGRKNVFAFRVIFWWGNFFSANLHLAGGDLDEIRPHLFKNYYGLKNKQVYICISEDPWEHHFEKTNMLPIDSLPSQRLENIIRSHHFIKLGRKIPLDSWRKLNDFCLESWKLYLSILK